MSEFYTACYTAIKIIYEGVNISADIAPYLLSFDYTDKSSDESDDIQITLEDKNGKWLSPWFPSKGDKIKASIEFYSYGKNRKTLSLPCGSFEVDEIEFSEPPMQITVKAVATPITSSAVGQLKTKAWENINLKNIAQEIANNNALTLFFDSTRNPVYTRKDQIKISDLNFLKGLCRDAGFACKCTAGQIVIFEESLYEEKQPVCTVHRGDSRIISTSFRSKTTDTYKAANVTYHDSLLDETQSATVSADDAPDNGKTLEINQSVVSVAEAESLGTARLRNANKRENSGHITLTGMPGAVGGGVIECSGWGKFDGRYFIVSAKHSYSESGYQVELEINETASSKSSKKKKNNKQKVVVQHDSLL